MLTPISIQDILLVLLYFLLKWLSLGIIFFHVVLAGSFPSEFKKLSVYSKVVFVVVLGAILNFISNMFFVMFYIFNTKITWFFNIIIATFAMLLIFKNIKKGINIGEAQYLKIVIFIFVLILFLRLAPLLGEYTYPGDDPKLYSLISRRILEEGGLPLTWGKYAKEEWIVEKIHLFLIGFPSFVAEASAMLNIPLYKSVALVTQFIVASTSLVVFVFLEIVTGNVKAGIYGMFLYGLLVAEPGLLWINWGGNAELASLICMVFSVAVTIAFFKENNFSGMDFLKFLPVGLSAMVITHPFSFVYYSAGLLSIIVAYLIVYREYKKLLQKLLFVLVAFCVAMFIALPVLSHMVMEEIGVQRIYEPSVNPLWTPIFVKGQTVNEAFASFLNRYVTVYGLAGVVFVFLFWLYLFRHPKLSSKGGSFVVLFLIVWWFVLFWLHENNPNGLWLVKFPLWYRIDPNRTFAMTSFPFVSIEAILLLHLERALKPLWEKLRTFFIVVLVVSVGVASLLLHGEISPRILISEDDAVMLDEISLLDLNGIFVLPNDAGQWIPAIAGKSVVIPMGVATSHYILNSYYQMVYPTFSRDPCSPLIAKYFRENNVSYVYIGGKQGLLDIYPYTFSYENAYTCRALKVVKEYGKAILYKYHLPNITMYSQVLLEPAFVWSGGNVNVFNYKDVLEVDLNNSWIAFGFNFRPEVVTSGLFYLQLSWWTEKNVYFFVEGKFTNGSVIQLTEPLTSAYFYKWGNGTAGLVHDYYVRIPHGVEELRFLFGGQGVGKLNRTLVFFLVRTDETDP